MPDSSSINQDETDSATELSEVIDWKSEVKKLPKEVLIRFLYVRYGFREESPATKETLLEILWNRGEETQKDILFVKQNSENLNKEALIEFARRKGLTIGPKISVRSIALELFLKDRELLVQASSLFWRQTSTHGYELFGKEPMDIKITDSLRKNLEYAFEEASSDENLRYNVIAIERLTDEIIIAINHERRIRTVLLFDDIKNVIPHTFKPVAKTLARYNPSSARLIHSKSRGTKFIPLFRSILGETLFEDPEFFKDDQKTETDLNACWASPPPDVSILKGIEPTIDCKAIRLTKMRSAFSIKNSPIIEIKSDDVMETIKDIEKPGFEFKAGNVLEIELQGEFLLNETVERPVKCVVRPGEIPAVNDKFRQLFDTYLRAWGVRVKIN